MRDPQPMWRLWVAAAGISAGWIVLNAGKPVHTDDAFTLYWARAIAPLPGETTVRYVNWIRFEEPLFAQTQHYMPGWALTLSAARRLLGEHATLFHWLQWPFAAMFLGGSVLLGRTFGAPPWPTLLLCATSAAFLIPSASLLGDMPAAGLGVLGLALWRAAPSLTGRVAAALLLALAGQMKQTTLVLYPLLLLDPAGRLIRKPRAWILPALSLALAGYYPDVPPHDPERRSVLGHVLWILQSFWSPVLIRPRLSYLAATAGAVLLTPVAYAFSLAARRDPLRGRRFKAIILGVLCIPALAAAGFWKSYRRDGVSIAEVPATANTLWFYLAIGLFVAWAALAWAVYLCL